MYKILITGGAGFIGTALARKLRSQHHQVCLIDLDHRFGAEHEGYETHFVDIRSDKSFEKISDKKFDYIFHLAAQTSGAISQEKPEVDVDTNVKGTLNLCNFARMCGAEKIIFSSSMATYGNSDGKISEDFPLNPLSNYGASKVAGEYYIKMFKQYGIEHTIFRLFNVYGPGQDMFNLQQGMASIFLAQSISSSTIKVTGSMERFRDFVFIDDVVDALLFGLESSTSFQTFNVGSEKATSVAQLIDEIIAINDKPNDLFEVLNIGAHEGDQFGTVSNCEKLKKLGWKNTTHLKEGLLQMYLYAKRVMA